jgi:hypothetical protein
MALESDEWWHRSPDGAAKDRQRDSWLRSQGWVLFRVDDEHGELAFRHQLMRVSRLVQSDLKTGIREKDWEAAVTRRPDLSVISAYIGSVLEGNRP